MKNKGFGEGEYFHIYNRSVEKRLIFSDDKDHWRFMTLLLVLQGDLLINQMNRVVNLVEHRRFDNEIFEDILEDPYVELISFCLMPNHFHLILRAMKEGGISKFMQRLLDAYTKYFNIRHERVGHLFGGRFQSVHIDKDEYLNHLSAYIHLNPWGLKEWRGKEIQYPWSSFTDFTKENRWGNFLNPNIIMDKFSAAEYRSFVEDTPIKKLRDRNEPDYLID
ncbi:MAG: transposase [Candidatus Berkelbacteria bacterium]|nr:transposase [Candidatus Berkelbacteria bacterium]